MEAIQVQAQVQAPVKAGQNVQIQPQAIQKGMSMQAILEGTISPEQLAGGGDFLAMMLAQLTGGEMTEDGAETEEGAEGEALEEQLKADGALLGMQMLAELLAANPMVNVVDMAELLEQGTGQTVTQAGTTAAGTNAGNLLEILTGQGKNTAETAQPVQPQAEQTLADMVTSVQKNTGQGAAQDGTQQNLSGEAQFKQSVMQAQKLLQGEPTQKAVTAEAPIDIDKLQGKVDASRAAGSTLQNTAPVQTGGNVTKTAEIPMPDAKELLAQVKTGIEAGLQTAKNEFVIKLKPDGLGEITVKLSEVGSHLSLSITTSSTQVQRMISGELAGLREAMKPLGVEVQQVVSQEAGHFNMNQQQNFGGHQHQQFEDDRRQNQFYWNGDNLAEDTPEPQRVQKPMSSSSLDAYI